MKKQMSHAERVQAALRGDDVDRPPVSMWRHFFAQETSSQGLADAMLAFQGRFDWDFMKVNPRASYHAQDWGLEMRYHGDRPPEMVSAPIHSPEDWLKLEVLDPHRGVLREHLDALETIARGLRGQVPFLMTVFTPLSIAARLAPSEEIFLRHLREHGENVTYALDIITETFISFSRACVDRGASGLFYATTSWATAQTMTEDEYVRFGRPFDLKLLNSLPDCRFHVLHVCKDNNMLNLLKDYPVHAFNWDIRGQNNLSLSEGKALLGRRAVIGGLDRGPGLAQAGPRELSLEVRGIRLAMGGKGWMLGPGCTISPDTPEANLSAIREAAEATMDAGDP